MRTVKADLHNHLKTSNCYGWKREDFNRAIDVAQQRLGQGGIFGLVNFTDDRYETFSGLNGYERTSIGENGNGIYVPEKDILVVKGQEVPTQQGHLLVLGLPIKKHLKENRSLEETLEEAKDNNGIIVADHPFYKDGTGPYLEQHPELIPKLDAVEVFNGEASLWLPFLTPRYANRKASDFFYDRENEFKWSTKVGRLASSDGHSFYELGKSWTALDVPKDYTKFNVDSFRESVKNSPHCEGIPDIGGFRHIIKRQYREASAKLGALDHILDMLLLKISRKLQNDKRSFLKK